MATTMTHAEFYEELIQMQLEKYTLDGRTKMLELKCLITDIKTELLKNRICGREELNVLESAYDLINDRLYGETF